MNFDITVIVPTFNVERFVLDALNSVINQKFKGKVELIIIDDCSTDTTVNILKSFKEKHTDFSIKILQQEKNMRQGTARNRGLNEAKGKYIIFLDADDFLSPDAFEKLFDKAEEYSCDFVVCDWAYYYEKEGLVYINNDDFLFKDILIGQEVESLFKADTYFSVNKLYRKSFLIENNIAYGEGYIYEDFEFYVQVAQYAEKVGIVQNPLYRVRVNKFSTTKTNTKGTLHIDSLLKAIENTLAKFKPRSEYSYYHVYKYLMRKSLSYLDERAPKGHKRSTLKKILTMLNNKNMDYPVPKKIVPLYHFIFRRKYLLNYNINKILFIWKLHTKQMLNPLFSIALRIKWGILDTKIAKKTRQKLRLSKINSYYKEPIDKNIVLFMGFDYRYAGNSKYFFDYLKNNESFKVYFVTKDLNVPSKYRIPPKSLRFYEKFAQAKVIIFESWIPLSFKKREGSIWIQLWHGTPIKKLFFDSHEYFISSFNRNHKRNKHLDIRRWDYLLADSDGGVNKLSSAFAYDKSQILNYGYPRVKWLQSNSSNERLKKEIKKSLLIGENKKIILYAPTWRDYNYRVSNPDFSYLMDVQLLKQNLSDEYVIIYKEHSMGEYQSYNKNVIVPDKKIELQNLILISDIVISDFSSIIFDAITIKKPFYLFIRDFEKYSNARGIYRDMHKLLKPFYHENEDDLGKSIVDLHNYYPFEEYKKIEKLYSSKSKSINTNKVLENKILELLSKGKYDN